MCGACPPTPSPSFIFPVLRRQRQDSWTGGIDQLNHKFWVLQEILPRYIKQTAVWEIMNLYTCFNASTNHMRFKKKKEKKKR